MSFGQKSHYVHLSKKVVLKIKKDLKDGMKQKDIAKKWNISQSLVSGIKTGRHWSSIKLN